MEKYHRADGHGPEHHKKALTSEIDSYLKRRGVSVKARFSLVRSWSLTAALCQGHLLHANAGAGGEYSQTSELAAHFGDIDKDNTGTITVEEMREALEAGGMPEDQIQELFSRCDRNGDGSISMMEYVKGPWRPPRLWC